jgi:Glycosyl hydrolase family 3 N terminal domain
MTMAAQERRPEHISPDVWWRTGRLSVQQFVGQLMAFGPFMAHRMVGRSLEELVVEGDVGMVMSVADLPHGFLHLHELAVKNGQMPLLLAGDFQRGVTTVGPAGIGAPCSWNAALVERAARHVACQMALAGTGLTFSPVADHALDTKHFCGMMHGQNVFRLFIRIHLALILAIFVWVVSRANSFP